MKDHKKALRESITDLRKEVREIRQSISDRVAVVGETKDAVVEEGLRRIDESKGRIDRAQDMLRLRFTDHEALDEAVSGGE